MRLLAASVCMQVDNKSKHRGGRAVMTRSKSRQSINNVPVPPDDKGGLRVKNKLSPVTPILCKTPTIFNSMSLNVDVYTLTLPVLVEQDVKSVPAAEADSHPEARPLVQSPGSVP